MRQAGDEARGDERQVARGDRAQQVAEQVGEHQSDQQPQARGAREQKSEQWRTDDDAQRVCADGVAGTGFVDIHTSGDLRQETHRHELADADRDAAERQREDPPLQRKAWL